MDFHQKADLDQRVDFHPRVDPKGFLEVQVGVVQRVLVEMVVQVGVIQEASPATACKTGARDKVLQ